MTGAPALPDGPNAAEIANWNTRSGPRWAAMQERLDALFAPLTEVAIRFAAPAPGERILDIGCGCGATLLELASCLGPDGSVVGVDVSKVMLELAAKRTASDPRIRVVEADASAYPFPPSAFSLLFSRFGVMFFDDPVAAFTHIRRSVAPDARLAFVTWRPMIDNPWFLVPLAAVRPLLPPQPPPDPTAPGPFAFADADRVRRILTDSGFASVDLTRQDLTLRLGGPGELDRATEFSSRVGPAAGLIAELDEPTKAAAVAAIRAALADHETAEGILMPASVWLVSART